MQIGALIPHQIKGKLYRLLKERFVPETAIIVFHASYLAYSPDSIERQDLVVSAVYLTRPTTIVIRLRSTISHLRGVSTYHTVRHTVTQLSSSHAFDVHAG